MAFERLEVRTKAARSAEKPAAITLSRCGGSKRPAAVISLSQELRIAAGLSETGKFDVLIGRGEDAGKLRLVASDAGIVPARIFKNKAFFVNLGFVPEIGDFRAKRTPTGARVIARGTVEVDIPDFDRGGDEDIVKALAATGTAPAEDASPAAAIVAAARKKLNGKGANGAAAPPAVPDQGPIVTHHGVSIDFTEDDERVTFKGQITEVTSEQAVLIRVLAQARPAPVGESHIVQQIWKNKPPKYATDELRRMASDLSAGLKPLGLELKKVPGVGYQLRGD